jgi:hypothetical protein
MSKEDSTDEEQTHNQDAPRGVSTIRSKEPRGSLNTNRTGSNGRTSVSSGLRHRTSTKNEKQQHDKHHPYSTGRDMNGKPIFTLAGPSFHDDENSGRSQNQHEAYVAPGYAGLNPAYGQPRNIRPIWGLADPIPRTLRPGNEPSSRDNQSGNSREDVLQPTDSQMEQGSGLRSVLSKTANNIHDATKDREQKHAQENDKDQRHQDLSGDDNEKQDEEVYDGDAEATHGQGEEDHMPLNQVQEELHNHHTLWAVFRTKLREPLAEVLAVSLIYCLKLISISNRYRCLS